MAEYILSCSSPADVSRAFLEEHKISFICFHYELGGKSYMDDLGQTIPLDEFYRRMVEGEMTRTSQISVGEYTDYFEEFLKHGKDVLHLSLSSGISGTYQSAMIAAEDLKAKYPERKLLVLDSLSASSGYGLIMERLAEMRDRGCSIDEVYKWAEENRHRSIHWFFSSDLTFFIRGGRISKTAGAFGKMLHICPLMCVTPEGKLEVKEKIRTKKKVIHAIVEKMEEEAEGGHDYDQSVFISNSACHEDAEAVKNLIEEKFPKCKGKVRIFDIGNLIGSHTGPGTVAMFFWGQEPRKD